MRIFVTGATGFVGLLSPRNWSALAIRCSALPVRQKAPTLLSPSELRLIVATSKTSKACAAEQRWRRA